MGLGWVRLRVRVSGAASASEVAKVGGSRRVPPGPNEAEAASSVPLRASSSSPLSASRATCHRVGAQIRSLGRATGGLAGGFEAAVAAA